MQQTHRFSANFHPSFNRKRIPSTTRNPAIWRTKWLQALFLGVGTGRRRAAPIAGGLASEINSSGLVI